MNKIKKNKKKILNIIMILIFFIIMFNMKTYVLAVGEKIEIKDDGEIITQSEGNLTTPKVLNVNIMKEKKLTLNTIGLDKTKLEYNIEEKEGNTIYYFYQFANIFNRGIYQFAYIKSKGIVAGTYDDYFFPKGKVYYRGGDWLKVRRPYKEELLWAEELKKEWRDKEMKWQKEQEREREEELVRALNGK